MSGEPEKVIRQEDSSKKYYACNFGPPLYIVIPFCILVSTFICTGGWRSGLRATLLGAGLLGGILLVKRFCPVDAGWRRRLVYFIPAGIIGGLSAAGIICGLELLIGSPTLQNNPYNQNILNLLWICPLYGFFVLGCYGLAFNLSRLARYFIVAAGAALANTFCMIDVAYDSDLLVFVLGVLKNCAVYYIPCFGNSLFYIFLFNLCADGIYKKLMRQSSILSWIGTIILMLFVGYFGFVIIGAMTLGIKLDRFVAQNKNAEFEDKLTGLIVIPKREEYYDCKKRVICNMPKNFEENYSYNTNKKNLRVKNDENKIEIEVLNSGEVVKEISHHKRYGTVVIVNANVYYMDDECLLRLSPPNYEKPELILENFNSYCFGISPDEKFVTRYDLIHDPLGRMVLCVTDLESKKFLALEKTGFMQHEIFWVRDLNEIRMPADVKKKK